MLPLACYLLAAGKTVAVEKAEPVYLRNEVAWKKTSRPRSESQ
ncbi:metal-dependent protease molecular chaperone [Klebsiella pneumoniae]|uniref:Metal-dependent protease molecular chaperone n=1 Tax=Klebsiella pneumoniae TaxID=573 RepID=A0A2X3FC01_KLEPN|nr:metal-dependent protease molecular chaperone [Klebsiella pneumoniae]